MQDAFTQLVNANELETYKSFSFPGAYGVNLIVPGIEARKACRPDAALIADTYDTTKANLAEKEGKCIRITVLAEFKRDETNPDAAIGQIVAAGKEILLEHQKFRIFMYVFLCTKNKVFVYKLEKDEKEKISTISYEPLDILQGFSYLLGMRTWPLSELGYLPFEKKECLVKVLGQGGFCTAVKVLERTPCGVVFEQVYVIVALTSIPCVGVLTLHGCSGVQSASTRQRLQPQGGSQSPRVPQEDLFMPGKLGSKRPDSNGQIPILYPGGRTLCRRDRDP